MNNNTTLTAAALTFDEIDVLRRRHYSSKAKALRNRHAAAKNKRKMVRYHEIGLAPLNYGICDVYDNRFMYKRFYKSAGTFNYGAIKKTASRKVRYAANRAARDWENEALALPQGKSYRRAYDVAHLVTDHQY